MHSHTWPYSLTVELVPHRRKVTKRSVLYHRFWNHQRCHPRIVIGRAECRHSQGGWHSFCKGAWFFVGAWSWKRVSKMTREVAGSEWTCSHPQRRRRWCLSLWTLSLWDQCCGCWSSGSVHNHTNHNYIEACKGNTSHMVEVESSKFKVNNTHNNINT